MRVYCTIFILYLDTEWSISISKHQSIQYKPIDVCPRTGKHIITREYVDTSFFLFCTIQVRDTIVGFYYDSYQTMLSLAPGTYVLYHFPGQLYHSSSMLDCRSTGRVINPASGAWFIPKFITLAQVVPWASTALQCRIWPKIVIFHIKSTTIVAP